ncbi:MAG: hypothetical protein P1U56_20240 [Saprospiraceae bacterium]|nr:hypothetical protein [Saprospiraceae bacterium]
MTDSKVYIALSHLSIYELNSFRKYLESPYFNMNEKLLLLFELYDHSIRKKNNGELLKEDVWNVIFKTKKYSDPKLRKLNSDLLKVFEEFLAQKTFDNNRFLKNNLILRAIRTRKIEKLYKSTSSSTDRNIEQSYNRSSDYIYAKFVNEKEKLELYSENEILRKRSKNIENEVNIDVIANYLDQYYLAEKLKYYVKLLGWKKMISLEQEINHIEELNAMVDKGDYNHIPPIIIYSTIAKTQLDPNNVDNYFKLKEQVNEYIDFFPDEEIRNIYDALLSFCVRRVNKGDLAFQKETLTIYKGALEKETIFSDGYITQVTFTNIVFFALRTGEYDWAEHFVEEYKDRLNDKDRSSSVALSLARIEFYKKNYDKVIELLQQVEMNSVVYNLSAKTILLFSYYELDEFDALDSFINSFRVYVNREKSISVRKKGPFKNLLKYINKIINLRSNDKEGIKNLRQEVEDTPNIVSKPWLLEKLDEKA